MTSENDPDDEHGEHESTAPPTPPAAPDSNTSWGDAVEAGVAAAAEAHAHRSSSPPPPPPPPPREREVPSRTESSPPRNSGSTPPPHHDPDRRRLFERAIPEIVKRVVERAVESGVEKLTELTEKPENLRSFVSEMRLPKEVISDVYSQIDDTKNGLYRVVAKELRDVLHETQIADEIVKVLTKLSFEIKTEVRFVPNDRAAGEGEDPANPRPKVKTEVTVKDAVTGKPVAPSRSTDKRR